MILPRRGEGVDRKQRAALREILPPEFIEHRITQLKSAGEVRLADVFSDEDVHRMYKETGEEFRERCFTMAVVLGLFVAQVQSREDACTTTVLRFKRQRVRRGLPPVCSYASAYCKARAKLPVQLIDALSERVAHVATGKAPAPWKWREINAYLVDGLVLRAPDTEANQEACSQPSSQAEGLGFPQVRMLVTVSLATGCITHYNTGPDFGHFRHDRSLRAQSAQS